MPRERYYHLDHYADLVHALVVALRERHGAPVALAGWSMGVSVILNLLSRHGDADIECLVFVSGTACATPGAVWFRSDTPQALEEEAVSSTTSARLTMGAGWPTTCRARSGSHCRAWGTRRWDRRARP